MMTLMKRILYGIANNRRVELDKRKMGILTNSPEGFAEAVSMLNALPQSVLAELVIVKFL